MNGENFREISLVWSRTLKQFSCLVTIKQFELGTFTQSAIKSSCIFPYTACHIKLCAQEKCKTLRYVSFDCAGFEVSKMGKTKIIHWDLLIPNPILYLGHIINSKVLLNKKNFSLHKCCSEGSICIIGFQF